MKKKDFEELQAKAGKYKRQIWEKMYLKEYTNKMEYFICTLHAVLHQEMNVTRVMTATLGIIIKLNLHQFK